MTNTKPRAMLLSSEPVSWIPRDARLEGIQDAYGCFVSGDSMEPAYERGNLLLVNPSAEVSPGDDCVFLRETADGSRHVLIKRLVRCNRASWTVKQYNPAKTYLLSRREWRKAHLVIGKYNRAINSARKGGAAVDRAQATPDGTPR